MKAALSFENLASRHPGISEGIGLSYEEAARVCLDRHHTPPVTFALSDNGAESEAEANWIVASKELKHAWANDIDTTEAGACALALAAVELRRGLVAVRRAETKAGADYYVDYPTVPPDNLENAIRLEVSGTANGDAGIIESRLKQKLNQASKGNSNLPAMAIVVGFAQRRIIGADLSENDG